MPSPLALVFAAVEVAAAVADAPVVAFAAVAAAPLFDDLDPEPAPEELLLAILFWLGFFILASSSITRAFNPSSFALAAAAAASLAPSFISATVQG